MPLTARYRARLVGPATIVALATAMALIWALGRPSGETTGSYVGQLAGAESILLMSIALVLISTLPLVESYFDGIDRAAIWHRRVAITGIVLLLPHILMAHRGRGGAAAWAGPAGVVSTVGLATLVVWAILPRWRTVVPAPGRRVIEAVHAWPPMRLVSRLVGDYEVWRLVHRTTGLFVAIGFAHGLADGTPFASAPILRWSYVVAGGTGLAFYAYRELLARRGHGLRDYQVTSVEDVGHGLTEIALKPLGRALSFVPGQFAMLHLETKTGWHRHPFTLAGAASDAEIRVTVKALGDFTSTLTTTVRAGMPAVLSGPHGRFTHAKGSDRQVWVAGGVGVTPFLSWVRSLDEHPLPGQVDFFYTTAGDAPYVEELRAIAAAHPELRLHVVDTSVEGRLTAGAALAAMSVDDDTIGTVSVFMCGPEAMVQSLHNGFRKAGVPSRSIHREHFLWR